MSRAQEAARAGVAEPPARKVPRWHLHRRLYDWVLHWAHTPYGTPALAVVAFAESSFFPVPPDVLLIALGLERRKRSFYYAAVCTVCSVLGGMFGYYLGREFFGVANHVVAWIVGPGAWYGKPAAGLTPELIAGFTFYPGSLFLRVRDMYDQHAFFWVFLAAFTPIPYKVFTVAGGYFRIPLMTLVLASALGRGLRFFAVSGLIYLFGPAVKRFLERYFNLATLLLLGLAILGFVLLKRL